MTPSIEASLASLVSIPSVTGNERGIRDHLAERLDDLGLEVDAFDADLDLIRADAGYPGSEVERSDLPLVIAHLNPGAPGRRILLNGHMDVVPPGDVSSWRSDPFQPVVEDGVMYGRGTCDMKGGVTAILETLKNLTDARHGGPVTVAFVPSEEDGGAGTLAAIRHGLDVDVAIIPEPTNLEIVTAHGGAITFALKVPGRAAHAATRREGISALDMLVPVLEALRHDEEMRNSSPADQRMTDLGLPYPTIVGEISGGSWASTVMDELVVNGRYGVQLGQTCDEAAADLREAIRRLWESHDFLSEHPLDLSIYGAQFGSCAIDADHPLAISLADTFEATTGAPTTLSGLPAATDMRLLVEEGGIPTVVFGPGELRHAHAADERIRLADIETCAQVLTNWIADSAD